MTGYPVYMRGVSTEPKVALTFDDGPNPPRTEQLLAILARADVRATFFLMGKWVERFPRTVERLIAAGHLIGNHGYSGQGWIGDYDEAEAVIGHCTGQPSRYLRAHTFNHAAFFQSMVARQGEGRAIGLDVDSKDWQTTDAEDIVRNVLDNPALGPGSIITFHDGAEYEEAAIRLQRPLPTLEALPKIIEGLRGHGLACVRLDEMTLAEPVLWEWGMQVGDLRRAAHTTLRTIKPAT